MHVLACASDITKKFEYNTHTCIICTYSTQPGTNLFTGANFATGSQPLASLDSDQTKGGGSSHSACNERP